MDAETRFKDVVRDIVADNEYPGPTEINDRLHHKHSRNLNGRETRWRREIMTELNVPLKRPHAAGSLTDYDTEYEYY